MRQSAIRRCFCNERPSCLELKYRRRKSICQKLTELVKNREYLMHKAHQQTHQCFQSTCHEPPGEHTHEWRKYTQKEKCKQLTDVCLWTIRIDEIELATNVHHNG